MKQKLRFCKRFFAFVLAFAMVLTTVNVQMLTVEAAKEQIDSSLIAPVGLVANYQSGSGTINVVWGKGENDTYDTYCVTISGKDTTDEYRQEYEEQALKAHDYACNSGSYEAGKTYTVELQGEKDGVYSPVTSVEVAIPGEGAVLTAPSKPVGVDGGYWSTDDANKGKIRVAWGNDFGTGGTPTEWVVSIDGTEVGTETQVAAYFYENKYAAGEHIISVVAKNSAGQSEATIFSFTLTDEQAGSTDIPNPEPDDNAQGGDDQNSVIDFDNVQIETYRSQDDGGWGGDSNVKFEYDGTTAVISADSFGWNAWAVQWKIKKLASDSDENVFAFDVESTISKKIVFKDENAGKEYQIDLVAGQLQHLEYPISGSLFNATFDLNGGDGKGSVTFTNMTFGPKSGSNAQDAPILTSAKALDKANGFKVGENVVLNLSYDGTEWAEQITALKVSNKTIDGNYVVDEDTLTLDASLFTKQGVYTIEVEAAGYKKATITLPIYDPGVADENWKVEWEDQFNGTALDETKWSYEIGIQSGEDYNSDAPVYWGNDEKQYYIKEAVEVKDGYLVITGNELTSEVKTQYNVTDNFVKYTSGRIRTVTDAGDVLSDGAGATTYGRIEAKMILPASKGYWPAFWMMPTSETTDLYGTWAASGELDIMEAVGQNPTQVNGTIHYGGPWPRNQHSGGTYVFPEVQTIAEEHLYAVEWEPGEIRWYVDDVLYHVENNWYAEDTNGEKYAYPAPFDEDFYILFNLAMSGNYVSNVDPDVYGLQMKVDYVRILTDENTDYDEEVTTPSTDRDSEFLGENGGYADLIKDKEYETLPNNAYGDGGSVLMPTEQWWSTVNTGAGVVATVEIDGDAAKFNVTKAGSHDYDAQLIQNIPLAKGYTYRVTFDAWTDAASGRTIRVAPGGDMNHGWKSYASGISPALTSTRKTYQFEFTMTSDSDPAARLEFELAGATGTVYIANVCAKALTDEELEEADQSGSKEPLADGEHIYNGTFDKGTGRLGNWSTEGTKGSTSDRNYNITVEEVPSKLIQEGIELLQTDTYKLTFDAQATNSGKVKVTLFDGTDGETIYVTKEYTLNAETGTYELEFTVPEGKGTKAGRLEIGFLDNGETYVIDNVSMKRLTDMNIEWADFNLYPIRDLTEFTTYDEVWNWANLPKEPTDIGNGEQVLVVETTPTGEANNWKVMLQRENVEISTGKTYHISYAIKASVADQNIQVKIEDTKYAPCYDERITIGTDWYYVDTTFTSTLDAAGALKFCLGGVDQDCTIYVKDVSIVMDGIPVPEFVEGCEVTKLNVGDSVQLQMQHSIPVADKYDSFTYKSSNPSVLEVSADGTLTAKSKGTAVITVISATRAEYSFTVEVNDSDTGNTDKEEPGTPEEPSKPEKPVVTPEKPATSGNNGAGNSGSSNNSGNSSQTVTKVEPKYYTVVKGDTMGKIARKFGLTLKELIAMNPQIKNPNLIYPGQSICVGQGSTSDSKDELAEGTYYTIVKGDCMYKIARKHKLTLNELYALNPTYVNRKYIYAGQKVRVK